MTPISTLTEVLSYIRDFGGEYKLYCEQGVIRVELYLGNKRVLFVKDTDPKKILKQILKEWWLED